MFLLKWSLSESQNADDIINICSHCSRILPVQNFSAYTERELYNERNRQQKSPIIAFKVSSFHAKDISFAKKIT